MGKRNGFTPEHNSANVPNYNKKLTEMKEKNASAQAELKAKYLQQIKDLNKQ